MSLEDHGPMKQEDWWMVVYLKQSWLPNGRCSKFGRECNTNENNTKMASLGNKREKSYELGCRFRRTGPRDPYSA